VPVDEPAVTRRERVERDDVREDETLVADDRGPARRQRPTTTSDADEPLTAEREAAANAQPRTVPVGPRTDVEERRDD
jgi:hypothetical protein